MQCSPVKFAYPCIEDQYSLHISIFEPRGVKQFAVFKDEDILRECREHVGRMLEDVRRMLGGFWEDVKSL